MDIKNKRFRARVANLLESVSKGTSYEIEEEFKNDLKSLINYSKLGINQNHQIKYRNYLVMKPKADDSLLEWHNRNLSRMSINHLITFQLQLFVKLLQEKQVELPDLILLSCAAIEIIYADTKDVSKSSIIEMNVEILPLEIRKKLNFHNQSKSETKNESK